MTNKGLYSAKRNLFPLTKVERDAGQSLTRIWKLISSPLLSDTAHEIVYMVVHNKLPVKERLFRIGMASDPYCNLCPDAEICDLEHFYCTCMQVCDIWSFLYNVISHLLGENVPNTDLIKFRVPSSSFDKEITWLLGTYLEKVWRDVVQKGRGIHADEFFGFLKFKYRVDQQGARYLLNIPELC